VVLGWLGKLTGAGYSNWFTHANGLQGFIAGANASYDHRAQAFGHPEVNYGWYLRILNAMGGHAQVFSRVVTISELLVGIGLLLGCLTGAAAAGGVALNILYITGGSAGPNGVFILFGPVRRSPRSGRRPRGWREKSGRAARWRGQPGCRRSPGPT
jgi:thiosulfate dehydrogenase [quinone] large subunit